MWRDAAGTTYCNGMGRRGQTFAATIAGAWLAATACGRDRAPNPADSVTLRVSATEGWQDTGITLQPGRAFTLRNVSGHIRDQQTEIDGGMGSEYVCGSPDCCEPLPRERRSALIGRVGSDAFLVGHGTEHVAKASGQLLLRVNDCDEGLFDNAGALTVEFVPDTP